MKNFKVYSIKQALEAVKYSPSALEFLPEEFIRAAVQRDGWALECVPEEFKTLEICFIAQENRYYDD